MTTTQRTIVRSACLQDGMRIKRIPAREYYPLCHVKGFAWRIMASVYIGGEILHSLVSLDGTQYDTVSDDMIDGEE